MFIVFSYGWLNLASLVLGIVAWLIPLLGIARRKTRTFTRTSGIWPLISIGACSVSLWFQILYNHHLVEIEDWSALMDTTKALVFVSGVLVIVTIILNIISMYRNRNRY